MGKVMVEQMNGSLDLLLGRKTCELFTSYWPFQNAEENPIAAGINKATKYVVSTRQMKFHGAIQFV
jgi:hypothetical protein